MGVTKHLQGKILLTGSVLEVLKMIWYPHLHWEHGSRRLLELLWRKQRIDRHRDQGPLFSVDDKPTGPLE